MNYGRTFRFVIFLIALVVLNAACSDEKENAKIQVWLTDAPGDFEKVNIDIEAVEINGGEDNGENGWLSLDVKKGIYNLLELTNGLDTLLGDIEIPAGRISQIRLILGENNSLQVNGEIFSLNTPSADQTGLKLQVHQELAEGITYKILLDFDVAQSVILTGAGQYKLKPVIRTIVEAQTGGIKGNVTPKESTPAIYAITGTDTVATTFTDSTGGFLLRGVPKGEYKILFVPNSFYEQKEITGVEVQIGDVTDIGQVVIE